MIKVRKSKERGNFDHGWLKTSHTFSFGDYFDRYNMNFRSLRVINEDHVAANSGFPLHPHRDMEIFTYIVSGELTHTDSLGHRQIIKRGDIQYTNAGHGIEHSEFNEHPQQAVHLLQIWIIPPEKNTAASYSYHHFSEEQKKNSLCLLATSKQHQSGAKLHQEAEIYASLLERGEKLTHSIPENWGCWLQLISGELIVGDKILLSGDGAAIEDISDLTIEAREDSEFLVFNLA